MKTTKTLFALFIFSIFINSCTILNKYEESTTNIDLTTFEEQGIFVTTGDISKDYNSLAIISVNCFHGYSPKNEITSKETNSNDDLYDSGIEYDNIKNFNFIYCSIEDLFLEVIDQAKYKGANGIIKLEIKNISRTGADGKSIQAGIEVSGLAIRIK